MVFAFATFGIVLAIILGVYWLLVVRPESAQESAVLARIGGQAKAAKMAALLKAPQRLSDMHSLDYVLARAGRIVEPFQRTIDPGIKLEPLTVRINPGPRGMTWKGERLVSTGAGLEARIVKVLLGVTPPPGAGLTTETATNPATLSWSAESWRLIWESLI